LIRLKISQGWTEDQIKQYFVDNYGARVLAEPPREGFSLLVYLIPPIIILAGAVILFRAFRQWNREAEPAPEAGAAPISAGAADDPDAAYIARLEAEMKKRE
jgi:cytochrome c-type biogenesis protein CcmH